MDANRQQPSGHREWMPSFGLLVVIFAAVLILAAGGSCVAFLSQGPLGPSN
jgi:hypothetical protein